MIHFRFKFSARGTRIVVISIAVNTEGVRFREKLKSIAKRTITKNRFVSVRSHETPRTESDKHCDQNKANV